VDTTVTSSPHVGLADIVDLDRYPIHDLDSPAGVELISVSRAALAEHGVANLQAFIRPATVTAMIALAGGLADQAWPSDEIHTVYFDPPENHLPASHPRRRQVRSAKHGIAYDYLPTGAPLRQLYESDEMTRFVAAVLSKPLLYRSADPLDALQITTFGDGEELGWHFDRSEFSVTVMYQQPEQGGEFEYCPDLRSATDENYAGVERVLRGERDGIVTLQSAPGTLAVFHGHHALHRVSAVRGQRSRINSVLTYGERPDMRLNPLTSQLFYGRVS
jgi:hypothetical protein